MSSLNRVTLIGRLGKDPEVRYTKSQTPFAKFSMATEEKYKSNGEQKSKTQWHNITIWGKLAEVAGKYLHKGKQIYLEGRIEYREYEQDGQKRYATNIVGDKFVMLGGKQDGQQSNTGGRSQPSGYGRQPQAQPQSYGDMGGGMPQNDDYVDDDIPF